MNANYCRIYLHYIWICWLHYLNEAEYFRNRSVNTNVNEDSSLHYANYTQIIRKLYFSPMQRNIFICSLQCVNLYFLKFTRASIVIYLFIYLFLDLILDNLNFVTLNRIVSYYCITVSFIQLLYCTLTIDISKELCSLLFKLNTG